MNRHGKDYFESEMRVLNEAARDFARVFPEQAGRLNLSDPSGRDPYVERLLEGMAFLSAQIRQKIDDDIPEISATLLNQLWPDALRAYPSCSILECAPGVGAKPPQTIEAGAVVMSGPVGDEHTVCRFRTVADLELTPLRLAGVRAEEERAAGTRVTLDVQRLAAASVRNWRPASLLVHVGGDPALALTLLHQLTTCLQSVEVVVERDGRSVRRRLGGQERVGFDETLWNTPMTPLEGRVFSGFHLLQDYFHFREKFQFVRIRLDAADWLEPEDTAFRIELHVRDLLPPDHHVNEETLRLHCVPVVNLYKSSSEPMRRDERRGEYKVVADASARESVQVFRVDGLTGINGRTGERREYRPLFSRAHAADRSSHFQATPRPALDGHLDTWIGLDADGDEVQETLSCDILAHNGSYPRRFLFEGSLTKAGPGMPGGVDLRNRTRPTPLLAPPERRDWHWALINFMALSYESIRDAEGLRRLLSLFDWSGAPQNARRIEGLSRLSVSPVDVVRRGAVLHGVELELTATESMYRSEADLYLFGSVLEQFLGEYASLNTFTRLRILRQPSNREMTWTPRYGTSLPI
jgi:type VI secretion system protein ImpG